MVFSHSWWIDFCGSEWPSVTLSITLWQNGDSPASDVELLKKGNQVLGATKLTKAMINVCTVV